MEHDEDRARAMRAVLTAQASQSGLAHAHLHPGIARGTARFAAVLDDGMATMLGYGQPVTASVSRDLPLQVLRARFSALANAHATQGAWAEIIHPDGRVERFGTTARGEDLAA